MLEPLISDRHSGSPADQAVEQPVDLGGRGSLFGIMTRPAGPIKSTGFVFLNSGLLHRVGPFRLYVDLARRIAGSGFPSIRLDQPGKGDSAAAQGNSARDATANAVTAAAEYLRRETGAAHVVVGGLCSGADDALQVAAQIPGLSGVFLFDGYAPRTGRYFVRHYAPRLLPQRILRKASRLLRERFGQRPDGPAESNDVANLRNWSAPSDMIELYRGLVENGIRILAVFTSQAYRLYNYPSQLAEAIGGKAASSLITEHYHPEATHLFPVTAHRRAAVAEFAEWTECCFGDRQEF